MEPSPEKDDELRPEYDLSQLKGGVRGKYAQRFAKKEFEKTSGSQLELHHFLQQAAAAMQPLLCASVIPLLGKLQGRLYQLGTGTLFRVADSSILVTAEHVVRVAAKHRAQLVTFDNADSGHAIPIPGEFQTYPDPADVAVARLDAAFVQSMPNRRFLTVHQTDRFNRRPSNGLFLIHGYPEIGFVEQPEYRLGIGAYTSVTGLYDGLIPECSDVRYHLLLTNSRTGFDLESGVPVESPERLQGISGCSIWQLHYDGLPFDHWTPDDASIVAVQTGVFDRGIIKATRWALIDQLLRESYPDLVGPLSLSVPDSRSSSLLNAV